MFAFWRQGLSLQPPCLSLHVWWLPLATHHSSNGENPRPLLNRICTLGKDHSVGGDSTQAAEGGLQQIPCSLKLSLGNPEHHCCPPQLPTGHPQCSFLHWLPPSSAAPQYGRIFMSYKETQRIKLSSLGDSVYILHWLSQMPFYFFCRDRVSV